MFSIIIPTYNEADQIAQTITKVHAASGMPGYTAGRHESEIIVVDAGSTDDTVAIAEKYGALVVKSDRKGRAAQMNKGASVAKYEILYFLHADSLPPKNFTSKILVAYHQKIHSGCFRLAFDCNHWFLKLNAWFTRFNVNAVRFGDQSLFVTKNVFDKAGGFREDLLMMEDQEIIHRLKKHSKFKVLKDTVTTSARKYLDNGIYKTQYIFYLLWAMYYLGYSQEQMLKVYRKFIPQNKL